MKRATLIVMGLMALLLAMTIVRQPLDSVSAKAAVALPVQDVTTVPLYRLFSKGTGVHFYTIDQGRKLQALGVGWSAEGTAAYVFDHQMPGTVPLYVLTNMLCPRGNYANVFAYTRSPEERDKLLKSPKFGTCISGGTWALDGTGVAGYIAAEKLPGTLPLYRLIHTPKDPVHLVWGDFDSLYTTSEKEMTDHVTQHGYQFVRIEGYVWSQPATLSSQPTKAGPKIDASKPAKNADTDLLNRGCTRTAVGSYNCPTIEGYTACQSYQQSGRATACATTADLSKQAAMDKELFSLGCTHLLGRPEEFICKTQKSLDACEVYHKNGRAKKCLLAK